MDEVRHTSRRQGPELDAARTGPVVEVDGLIKRYGRGDGALIAVNDIRFDVRAGEVFGFLGPNGAGKTTTISVLCTLLQPNAGTVRVAGFDVAREPDAVRRTIGVIFQDPTLDNQLTAQENLDFHAFAYGVPLKVARARSEVLLRILGLWERRRDQVKTFSGGMKRRLEIARGLLHRPRLLFLDEPTQGLDPQTRGLIWKELLGLRDSDGVTLFLTTHYMDEAEYCDRIAIIDHGEIVALDTPDGLKARVGGDVVTVTTSDDELARAEIGERWGLTVNKGPAGLWLEVERGDRFVPELVRGLSAEVLSISVRRPTLDDVFQKLTGRAIREHEANELDRLRQHGRMAGRR
jgi:ABC-2 type transport system ATP-binding protein